MWAKEREGVRGDNTIRKRRNLEGGVTLQSKRRVGGRVVKLAYDQKERGRGGRVGADATNPQEKRRGRCGGGPTRERFKMLFYFAKLFM